MLHNLLEQQLVVSMPSCLGDTNTNSHYTLSATNKKKKLRVGKQLLQRRPRHSITTPFPRPRHHTSLCLLISRIVKIIVFITATAYLSVMMTSSDNFISGEDNDSKEDNMYYHRASTECRQDREMILTKVMLVTPETLLMSMTRRE